MLVIYLSPLVVFLLLEGFYRLFHIDLGNHWVVLYLLFYACIYALLYWAQA